MGIGVVLGKAGKDFFDFPGGEGRGLRAGGECGEPCDGVGDELGAVRARLAGSKDDAAVVDDGIEGIAGAEVEAAAERSRKNDLTLGGKFGVHGKTILPWLG